MEENNQPAYALENITAADIMDAVFTEIVNNLGTDLCMDCPVTAFIREVRLTLKDSEHDRIISELGLADLKWDRPCCRTGGV